MLQSGPPPLHLVHHPRGTCDPCIWRADIDAAELLLACKNRKGMQATRQEQAGGLRQAKAADDEDERKKKESNNRAQLKSRMKRHFDNAEKELNGPNAIPFARTEENAVEFTDAEIDVINTKVNVSGIRWEKGWRRSKTGAFREYGTKSVIEEAVIVQPEVGERRALDANRIKLDPPDVCLLQYDFQGTGTHIVALTGPCSAPDEQKYRLVRFSNQEVWWVPDYAVKKLASGQRTRNGVVKFDPTTYTCGKTSITARDRCSDAWIAAWSPLDATEPDSRKIMDKVLAEARRLMGERGGCIGRATAAAVANCCRGRSLDTRMKVDNPRIYLPVRANLLFDILVGDDPARSNTNEATPPARGASTGRTGISGSDAAPDSQGGSAPTRTVAHWDQSDGSTKPMHPFYRTLGIESINRYGGVVPALCAEFKCLWDGTVTTTKDSWPKLALGVSGPYGEESGGRGAEGAANKEKKRKERPGCKEEGCKKKAHTSTKGEYCLGHSKTPRKMCTVCNKYYARCFGGTCNKCVKKPDSGDDMFCQGCLPTGRKNKPRKLGGLCASCIRNGRKLDRKCTVCHTGTKKHKGGLCHSCHKRKMERGKLSGL